MYRILGICYGLKNIIECFGISGIQSLQNATDFEAHTESAHFVVAFYSVRRSAVFLKVIWWFLDFKYFIEFEITCKGTTEANKSVLLLALLINVST